MKNNKDITLCRYCKGQLTRTGSCCGDDGKNYVLKCKNCDLVQLTNFDHIDENYYSSKQYITDYINLNNSKDIDNARLRENIWNKKRLKLIKNNIRQCSIMSVLDYGCGHGGFLEVSDNSFKYVIGYDLSEYYYNIIMKKGWNVTKSLNGIKDSINILILFHVLEHLKYPWDHLSGIIKQLKNLKYVIIEVPNTNEILKSIFKNEAYLNNHYCSDHLYYFTHKTLTNILENIGLVPMISTGIQRYSIANHFGWLAKGKGGFQNDWIDFNDSELNKLYENILVKNNLADSIFIISEVVK